VYDSKYTQKYHMLNGKMVSSTYIAPQATYATLVALCVTNRAVV